MIPHDTFYYTETMIPSSSIPEAEWRPRLERHVQRLDRWAVERRQRSGVGVKHPVHDFLFDYYSFRPSQLLRWSPGVGVILEGADHASFNGSTEFTQNGAGIVLMPDSFPAHRLRYLEWAINYLSRVAQRPAQLSCFGLHEWAMVYRTDTPRYPSIPMRLPLQEIHDLCESQGFRCTHYDAFRFFTLPARALNGMELTRDDTSAHDQPGCIHVSMDLYRFAYKIAPYIPAELTADAFELAMAAREIDMRASPYDLEPWGFTPVKIEDVAGRAEYAALQLGLSQRAAPIRSEILGIYRKLLTSHPGNSLSSPREQAKTDAY